MLTDANLIKAICKKASDTITRQPVASTAFLPPCSTLIIQCKQKPNLRNTRQKQMIVRRGICAKYYRLLNGDLK